MNLQAFLHIDHTTFDGLWGAKLGSIPKRKVPDCLIRHTNVKNVDKTKHMPEYGLVLDFSIVQNIRYAQDENADITKLDVPETFLVSKRKTVRFTFPSKPRQMYFVLQ